VPAWGDIHICLPYPGTSVVVGCHKAELVQAGLVAVHTCLAVGDNPAQAQGVDPH